MKANAPTVPDLMAPEFRLRPIAASDLEAMRRHADHADVARFTSHRFPHPFTEADAARFLAHYLGGGPFFMRVIDVGNEFAGALSVHVGEGVEAHSGELGYWLGHAHWGRGIMGEAVAEFVPMAFEALRLERIWARVTDGNTASIRLLERNGFRKEGLLRRAICKHGVLADTHMFGRLRDDPDGT